MNDVYWETEAFHSKGLAERNVDLFLLPNTD